MALGTNGFTFADLTVDIPQIWGQQINDYFRYNLQLASFFVDRSEELMDGGYVVHTPNLSALTVSTKTNNAEVTLSLKKGLIHLISNWNIRQIRKLG